MFNPYHKHCFAEDTLGTKQLESSRQSDKSASLLVLTQLEKKQNNYTHINTKSAEI